MEPLTVEVGGFAIRREEASWNRRHQDSKCQTPEGKTRVLHGSGHPAAPLVRAAGQDWKDFAINDLKRLDGPETRRETRDE